MDEPEAALRNRFSSYSWSLKNPRDLLAKAKRELRRMEKAHDDECCEEEVDHAFNLAITIHSMSDWVEKTHNIDRKRIYERKHGECLKYCRDLSNGSKHLILDRDKPMILETYVSAKSISDPIFDDMMIKWHQTGRSEGRCIPMSSLRSVLKCKLSDGCDVRVKEVFKLAIETWEELLDGLDGANRDGEAAR